ncbi:helix-turn-helix domain-containing protein [Clostridium sporogenes]|uniref:helix-turn-helix domain-containing protein n=1 Tax=Clostridium sporogenes TaxID=1509 RepID=UPI0013D46FAE|nr:helix-turn-helix transcriptional regulator [Clostridium sporogenes]NFQ67344.1 helix-turn-helix transcriptional regulator [Clostridium sporogenes]
MFGENIKRIREDKELGVNELSRLSGVNASYISAMERGEKENPTITTLNKIADALEVPLDYLTRKSAKAMIEDKLKELGITFEELSNKTNIPVTFFSKLDDIIPDESDYKKIQATAWALNIEPIDLVNALHRQEPPVYDWTKFDKKLNQNKEEKNASLETGEFTTPQAAMQFILKQPSIMGFGGFDASKMSDQDIIDFANELLNIIKMLGPKYNK